MLPPTHPAAKDIQRIYREIHEVSGDVVPINMVKGIGHLRDPRLNKVFKIHLYYLPCLIKYLHIFSFINFNSLFKTVI